MKKTIVLFCLFIVFILSLTGCSSYADLFPVSKTNETEITSTPTAKLVTPTPKLTPTPLPTNTPLPYHQLGFVNLNDHDSNLRVRTGPGADYPCIGAICHGLTVRIFTEKDGWYEIEFDGQMAFCSKDYIIIDSGLTEPVRCQYCTIVTNISKTAYRDIPGGEQYSVGDRVDITGDGITDGVAVDRDMDKSADAVEITAKDELIDVAYYSPDIYHNIDLATKDNQFNQQVYTSYYVLLQKEVLEDLRKAAEKFRADGYYIKIYDAYRPLRYQETLFALSGDSKFFNNSETGSNHNRGASVDMTLVDEQGVELEMPSKVHDFSEDAFRDNADMSIEAAKNLEYMTSVMLSCGFSTYQYEWWHFNHINAKLYELSDYSDLEIIKIRKK